MRLRNVKGSREAIENDEYVIKNPEDNKGRWNLLFNNDNEVHIEIGMGKGQFILNQAINNSNINYIGIEKFSSVLYRALQKRDEFFREKERILNNIKFIRFDAENIKEIFEENEVKRIYLNFSDPWPKDKHEKRRLTSKEFLSRYDKILDIKGDIIFKTDNKDLFDFTVDSIEGTKWDINEITYDLHNSEYVKENIMTEYETKFVLEGKPIYRLKTSRLV